jgi:hypothetical protein
VHLTLVQGRPVAVSTLHNVARTYVRRMAAENPKARSLGDLGWDLELFKQAVYEQTTLRILGQEAA